MERVFNPNKREDIIDYGRIHNKKVDEINSVLKRKGMELYNPLTYGRGYAEMPRQFMSNMGEFGKALQTVGGAAIKGTARTIDDVYRAKGGKAKLDVAKQNISKLNNPALKRFAAGAAIGGAALGVPSGGSLAIPGALAGGMIGMMGPKGLANTILSPYNVTVEDVKNKKVNPLDIVQGIQRHPFDATLDIGSLGGAKAGKALLQAGGNVAGSVAKKTGISAARQLFPDKEMREFNRYMTDTLGSSRVKSAELYRAYNTMEAMPLANRMEIVNNIRANTGKLTKDERAVANAIKKDLIDNQNLAIELGLVNKEAQKADVVAQYVMHNIADKSNLLHKDIVDIYKGNKLRKEAKDIIKQENISKEIDKLIKQGEELHDNDKIAFLSQIKAPSKDPLSNIIASELNTGKKKYFDISRIIGRTGAKRLGDVLEDTIKFQLDQVGYSREGTDVFKKLLNDNKITKGISKVDKGALVNKFKQSLAEDFAKGEPADLNKALRSSGISKLEVVDDVYLKAINNAFKKSLNAGSRRFLNMFKKNVLGQPHWVFENRVGNIPNNIMEGVTVKDYRDVDRYSNVLPEQLKQQTSFANYTNEGIQDVAGKIKSKPLGLIDSTKTNINRYGKAIRKFKNSDKYAEDFGELLGEMFAATGDLTSTPWFKLESSLELRDRYANFIRQAKREAKATGKSVEYILKKANTNQELFNKLNTNVNKSLGDYAGKNYFLPSRLYDLASEYIPFYRFLTQTGRTTLHQMANRPLSFNTMVTTPSRIGYNINEDIRNKYNVDDENFEGGVPYFKLDDGSIRTLGVTPIPIGDLALQFGSGKPSDILSIFTPGVSTIPDVMKFKRFGNTASTPRLTEMKLDPRYSKRDIENFSPTLGESLGYGLNTMLGLTFNPYIQWQRYGRGVFDMATGRPMYSTYDTNPFIENPLSYAKTVPSEYVGNWVGIRNRSLRKPNKYTSKKEITKNKNRAKYYNKKMSSYNKSQERNK